jgi:membrane protein
MNRQTVFKRVRYPVDVVRQTRVGDLLERAIRDYSSSHGSIYAAAITYYLLLSIFPLLIVIVAVLGLLARDPDFQTEVVDLIVRQLPSGSGVRDQVVTIINGIARPRSGLVGLVAFVGALWTASGVFGALRRALNNAFDVPMKRSYFRGRLRDLASVAAVVVLVIASTALTVTLALLRSYLSRWFDGALSNVGWGLIFLLLPLVLSFAFFLLLYRLIPNHTLRWGELWLGALIAAVAFELAKALFTIYLATFASYDEVYGALGSLIALLVFIFIVANITILSAEIASEVAKARAGRDAG